jgi:recombination protein RecR
MARLVDRLCRLPGIGNRSAQRLAFYLLKASPEEAAELAAAIVDLKRNTKQCAICCNVSESDPCPICADPRRDRAQVLVVEQPNDLATVEAMGMYRGTYHVLMGRLAPLDGLGAGELNIEPLLERVKAGGVREVIIGTNPTLEGDGTGLYLAKQLARLGVKVTRLARGLPTGANLDMVSKAVLADALQGRQSVS